MNHGIHWIDIFKANKVSLKTRPHDQSDHQIENKVSTNWKKRKCPNDQNIDTLSTKWHQTVKPRPNDQSTSQLSTNSHQSDHFDKLCEN